MRYGQKFLTDIWNRLVIAAKCRVIDNLSAIQKKIKAVNTHGTGLSE
jgi:hypothetical protein